jgi:tripartite-type tricarboxylate transporter receptor subunit TctC
MNIKVLFAVAVAVAWSFAGSAAATAQQKWPSRNIEVIIPFSPGSGVDLIGRSTAAALTDLLGQTTVVINREGASGTLGFGVVAAAAPDGHTLAFGPTTPIANAPYLVKGVRYNVESFDYICQIFENIFSLSVGPQSKIASAQELIALAREKPGTVTFGHAGLGSIPHLSAENFADALKLKLQQVPFRGDGPVVPALLSGQVDVGSVGISSIRGNDRIRPLLVFADERHPAYPNVPIAKELGVATSVPPGHNGLYAPKGLPPAVRATLERACADGLKHEAVLRAINNTGMTIKYLNSAQFHSQTAADYKSKGELIQRLGLKTD